MIITIDGPAGAGKSSAAKALAQTLGIEYLDTGAMYRVVTLHALQSGTNPRDFAAVARLLPDIKLEMPLGKVVLNGKDVSAEIRSTEVTAASGAVADNPEVRRFLGALQRQIAAGRDFVCEGRDQGTVVFPEAECKFFVVADPSERARRRQRQLAMRGEVVSVESILQSQQTRDERDQARDLAPMVPAADAITIDTTNLSLDEVVARMEQEVRRCRAGHPTSGTN